MVFILSFAGRLATSNPMERLSLSPDVFSPLVGVKTMYERSFMILRVFRSRKITIEIYMF